MEVFEFINQAKIKTESSLSDTSNWDDSKWHKHALDRILELLENKKPCDRGNKLDALTELTAIKTGITLITGEDALLEGVNELCGKAVNLEDFRKETESKNLNEKGDRPIIQLLLLFPAEVAGSWRINHIKIILFIRTYSRSKSSYAS